MNSSDFKAKVQGFCEVHVLENACFIFIDTVSSKLMNEITPYSQY